MSSNKQVLEQCQLLLKIHMTLESKVFWGSVHSSEVSPLLRLLFRVTPHFELSHPLTIIQPREMAFHGTHFGVEIEPQSYDM
jgi:hypothetical protein